MQKMSYQQNWRACLELEEERQQVLKALFEHHDMPNKLKDIADIIEQVINIDSESLFICEEARSKEVKSINQAKSAYKAAVTYLSSS